jgi:hypothetical protein
LATRQGQVHWDAATPTSFVLDAPQAKVEIQSGDRDGEHPYFLVIRNAEGMVIAQAETIPGEAYLCVVGKRNRRVVPRRAKRGSKTYDATR